MRDFLEGLTDYYSSWEINQLTPLQYAYIGDVVYEQYIRFYVLKAYPGKVNDLNKRAVSFVNAGAQAKAVKALEEVLTDQEWSLVKWGRNTKSLNAPKGASRSDYRYATGFETLLGKLAIEENWKRVEEIITKAIQVLEVERDE